MKTVSLILCFMVVTACSSVQTSLNSQPVPPERFYGVSGSDKNSAEIAVIRDRSLAGSICYYAVFVDDKLIARIGPSEKAALTVEPGERHLKITRDPEGKGLCGLGSDMTEEKVDIGQNEKRLYRLSMDMSGWPSLSALK